jgi:DNA-directed RNA polymerase subunit H (RpoH/RPB5)
MSRFQTIYPTSEIIKIRKHENVKVVDVQMCSVRMLNKILQETFTSHSSNESRIYIVDNSFNSWDKINNRFHRFMFRKIELEYNILDNKEMVPCHKKVADHEIDIPSLSRKEHLNVHSLEEIKRKLPTILSYDPVVRRLGLCPGDVVSVENDYYSVVR